MPNRRRRRSPEPVPHPDGYRLTTAEILYRLPDHPAILQTYVWQALDLAPGYPALHKFLAFWERELEGKLHSVRVASAALLPRPELRAAGFWIEESVRRIH